MENFKSAGGIYHVMCWDPEKYSNESRNLLEYLGPRKCNTILSNVSEEELMDYLESAGYPEVDCLIKNPCENCPGCHRKRDGHVPINESEFEKITERLEQEQQLQSSDDIIGQAIDFG